MESSARNEILDRLARRIQAISEGSPSEGLAALATGWEAVDAALASDRHDGGLRLAGIHEFLGPLPATECQSATLGPRWRSGDEPHRPLALMGHLAGRAAALLPGRVVWIGRACWPNPAILERLGLLDRSLLVDAPDAGERLWAIDLAMRSCATACVVGDGKGFKIAATRRLELTATQRPCLVLLGRPGSERTVPSSALTRWTVRRRVTDSLRPGWTLELVHGKGMHLANAGPWPLEWDCAKGAVTVSAAMVDRSASASTPQEHRRPNTAAG
jgi:hypothetical protein